MKKKFGNKRYFLNPKEGVAAASFSVEVDNRIVPKKDLWPALDSDANLELSDCNRKIYLDFDVWVSSNKTETLRKIRERRVKLQRLKDIVDGFVEATSASYDYLESQLDDYCEAYKKREAQDKKKKTA